jgi:NTP pyrophosphatase (non-canonical NTP hydrolase)
MAGDPPRHSRDQASVVRAAKDILLKRLAQSLRGTFLTGLGLDLAPIVEVLPAELPVISVRTHLPDLLFRLADGTILHVEFQITLSPDDLRRFSRYNYAVADHYEVPLYTVVLYGPGILDAPQVLALGSHQFTVRNLYLGRRDGEAVVERLRAILASGASVSASERLDVMLLPLMRQSRPLSDVLEEVAELARALPQAEREEMIGTMVGFAYNYVEPAIADRLLEVLRMANVLEDLLVDTLVRGQVESRREDILSFLTGRFGAVSDAVKTRIDQVDDPDRLKDLVRASSTAQTLEAFEQTLEGLGG